MPRNDDDDDDDEMIGLGLPLVYILWEHTGNEASTSGQLH